MTTHADQNLQSGQALGRRLRDGDLSAAPAILNLLEDRSTRAQTQANDLLEELSPQALGGEARGHLLGLTGPPGAGKSALLSQLVGRWRNSGRTVSILAVDPSSRRSGGSLLADRVRIEHDPADTGVLIRSQAAGNRLGGLAFATREAAQALVAAYDLVVVETVGVGQSETEVAELCDTVCVVVQPASGDTLQFLKAGIMETPDVLVVTKADLGDIATAAQRDLTQALSATGGTSTPVICVSSVPPGQGVEELVATIDTCHQNVDTAQTRPRARRHAALERFEVEYGQRGLRALGGLRATQRLLENQSDKASIARLEQVLIAESKL